MFTEIRHAWGPGSVVVFISRERHEINVKHLCAVTPICNHGHPAMECSIVFSMRGADSAEPQLLHTANRRVSHGWIQAPEWLH